MSNTTDTKKYRLLKDISMPYRSIKAGTVGDCLEPYEYISFGEGTNYLAYSIKDIKNKPDWFEEVLPVSEPVKEKIEIELYQDIWSEMTHKVSDKGLFHEYRLLFYTVDNPKEKIPAIKQAIECLLNNYPLAIFGGNIVTPSVLNGDTVVEDKGLKTGIMSQMDMYHMGYKDGVKYGNLNTNDTGKEYAAGNPISRDTWKETAQTPQPPLYKEQGAEPSPIQEDKPILFTTEDGVGIKDGDKWYSVKTGEYAGGNTISQWEVLECNAAIGNIPNPDFIGKRFSTKSAAEKYILRYKPVLCIDDCIIGLPGDLFKRLEQKAKQKISQ